MADAVQVEPVSSPNSLLTGEKNREFCKIAAQIESETANNGAVTGLTMRISCSTEQGIISGKQGVLVEEQGIISGKIDIIGG